MLENNPSAFRRSRSEGLAGDKGDNEEMTPDLSRQILDAIEQGVAVWSGDGTCLQVNSHFFDVLGLPRGFLLQGQGIGDFLDRATGAGLTFSPAPEALIETLGRSVPFQFTCETPKGFSLRANARALRGGGYVTCFSDVTETRNAVVALATARQNAEEAEQRAAAVLDVERSRQRESERLAKLDEWLQSCKSLEELFKIVSRFMEMVMPTSAGQLYTYSNSRDMLVASAAWNGAPTQDRVTPQDCWALRRGRKYLYDPDDLCFVCDHVANTRGTADVIGRYLCIPVIAHGETVGLFHIEFQEDAAGITPEEPIKFCARCAERISMAIANVKLRDELQEQSTRDPLTGLYNRRYYLDAIRREILIARHAETSFAVLAIDVDHFKTFNDTHGHDAGDEVLRSIAERMRGVIADQGIACRTGGEEFSVLLPNSDRTIASGIAEDLRVAISDLRVMHLGVNLPQVTLSVGISVFPTHGVRARDLIKQADMALYRAKKDGRNVLRVAEGERLTFFE